MSDEASPEFSLPEWGTEGAPTVGDRPAPADGWSGVALLTTDLPDGFVVGRVLGVVTGSGSASLDGDGDTVAADGATAAALGRLVANAAGADAIVGIRISTVTRKDTLVVVAYGTAVTVS